MASSALKEAQSIECKMDMTPMIDVVFNLVIFFMLVTDLNQKDIVELTLPLAHMSQQDKNEEKDNRVILNIGSEGKIIYKGQPISLDQLGKELDFFKGVFSERMKQKGEDPEEVLPSGGKASKLYVLLRADRNVPWQHVQWLMTVMAEHKLYKLQFATKKFIGGPYEKEPEEAKMLGGKRQNEVVSVQ
jgi:biopolymer transport protein ExbD